MATYSCSAQPQSIYPCSAQPPSIPAVPNCTVSGQCPTAEYPQCPTAEYPCSAQLQSFPAGPNCRVSPIFQKALHFLSNKSFRVGMLEVNKFCSRTMGIGSRRVLLVDAGLQFIGREKRPLSIRKCEPRNCRVCLKGCAQVI